MKFFVVNKGGSAVFIHESEKDLLIDRLDVVVDCGRKQNDDDNLRTDSEITGRRTSKRLDNNGSQINCLIKQMVITIMKAIKHDNATQADMLIYRDGDEDEGEEDLLFMKTPSTTRKSADQSLVILHMFE